MASLQFHFLSFRHFTLDSKRQMLSCVLGFGTRNRWIGSSIGDLKWSRSYQLKNYRILVRATGGSSGSNLDHDSQQNEVIKSDDGGVDSKDPFGKLQEIICSSPPLVFLMRNYSGNKVAIGFCVAMTILAVFVRVYVVRKARPSHPGSVADLVKRGQLRSDRRGISRPLKYEDPFNNPLVKVGKSNSTVEMCGKVYRLAPVTLTEEQRAVHQKRRSRAYQWKRPTMFLKEGDLIPPDVDPDTIRWIPANHPFATTASDIDEELAQNNVYQKHGVPFRIQAEHEALQRKLETLQNEEKLNKLVIDQRNAIDFERPYKSKPRTNEKVEPSSSINQVGDQIPPSPDTKPSSSGVKPSSDEEQKF